MRHPLRNVQHRRMAGLRAMIPPVSESSGANRANSRLRARSFRSVCRNVSAISATEPSRESVSKNVSCARWDSSRSSALPQNQMACGVAFADAPVLERKCAGTQASARVPAGKTRDGPTDGPIALPDMQEMLLGFVGIVEREPSGDSGPPVGSA